MFGISFSELLLVGLVALLVLGPERLPSAARTAGLWVGRLKRSFNAIKQEVEREIGADEIRRQLHNEHILSLEEEARKIMAPHPPANPAPATEQPLAEQPPAPPAVSPIPTTPAVTPASDLGPAALAGSEPPVVTTVPDVPSAPVNTAPANPAAANTAPAANAPAHPEPSANDSSLPPRAP
jgi:sec-independent protein translocase protein TatB